MGKSQRSERLADRVYEVGEEVRIGKNLFRVVERQMPEEMKDRYSLACSGCWFKNKNCAGLACSKPDRFDGKFVWFVKID